MLSKNAVAAGSALLVASVLVLMAGRKHYSSYSHSATLLAAEDKFGIPISEDEDGVSATEMEKTDLLMLHTVQQLESKVNSLSKQMKQVTGSHSALSAQSSSSELQAKVKALSTSMLDTIQAVQHLSAQVSQLELKSKLSRHEQEPPTSTISMIQPQSDAAAFITDTSRNEDADAGANNLFGKNYASKSQSVVAKKVTDVSKILSRLASDMATASSVIGQSKTEKPDNVYINHVKDHEKKVAIQKELRDLQNMMAKASKLLKSSESPQPNKSSQSVISSISPTPVKAGQQNLGVNKHETSALSNQPLSSSKGAEPPPPLKSDMSPAQGGIAYDAPSTFASDLLSDSLGSTDLKKRVAEMQAQVQALARRERGTLDALPTVENQISRDRAVLSDGLQSLEIAQDRLVLAAKAAEEIGAGPSAEETKVLAEQRESAIQAEVNEELHRLAQEKRAAAEGPRLARTLHERRAQLRRLESELQRATLLEKARDIESTKDFAG